MHITSIVAEKCTGCEDCVFVCTVRAIKMVDGKAVILDNCNDCKDCWNRCSDNAIFHGDETAAQKESATAAADGDWRGVLVWLEAEGVALTRASREVLAAGRQIADSLGVYLEAYLIGGRDAGSEAVLRGVDRVFVQPPSAGHSGWAMRYEQPLLDLIRRKRFEIVLFPDYLASWELAPRLAQKLQAAIFPPATSLSVDSESRSLSGTIRAYEGRLLSDVTTGTARPQLALVMPGAFPEAAFEKTREGEIVELN